MCKTQDKFLNENKTKTRNSETNSISNRKESKEMKSENTVYVKRQKLYEICNEVEKGFDFTRITLGDSLIRKFEAFEATEENIRLVEQLIHDKTVNVYAEYIELKKMGRFPQPHVAIITLHDDDKDELVVMVLKEKTDNFDGIRCSVKEYDIANLQPTRSLYEIYHPDNVVIDGNLIIEYGMYKLPNTVNHLGISKLYIEQNGKDSNITLSAEEAKPLFEKPVYQVPLKEEVISWVRDKSMNYIDEQPDTEEGHKNIAMAHKRFEKFVAAFSRRYDDAKFVATLLDYYRCVKEEPENTILHHVLEMKIGHLAAELLLIIKEMTEFNLADCYWEV